MLTAPLPDSSMARLALGMFLLAMTACVFEPRAVVPRQSTTADAAQVEESMFIQATDPPAAPPALELAASAGAVVPAVLYTVDWTTRHSSTVRAPSVPVPWPPVARLPRAHSFELRVATGVLPDVVLANAYAEVTSDSSEPLADPVASFSCHRFETPTCRFAQSEHGFVLSLDDLGLQALKDAYIAIFMAWYVPEEARGTVSGETPSHVSASWLLRTTSDD
jgi:hypothetical protein